MLVIASDERVPSLAVNVTLYVPACALFGVHENVPLVLPAFVVNVLPVVAGEEDAVNEASVAASASDAVTTKVRRLPSVTDCVAGAVTTGARFTLFTVIAVDAVAETPFATAVNVAV
jgi:hypothetical protein